MGSQPLSHKHNDSTSQALLPDFRFVSEGCASLIAGLLSNLHHTGVVDRVGLYERRVASEL